MSGAASALIRPDPDHMLTIENQVYAKIKRHWACLLRLPVENFLLLGTVRQLSCNCYGTM